MPIEGYFKTGLMPLPAPYVQAIVNLPRLQVSAVVELLIDTGADNTCLHPGDMAKLGIDYRKLRRRDVTASVGVGGSLKYYREEGQLFFRDGGGDVRGWELYIHLCCKTASPAIQGLPSLLGRDFINLCSVQIDKSKNQFTLDPLNVVGGLVLPPVV